MKKVFKASLVAATVAFAFAANAADVAIAPVVTVTNEAVTTNVAITPATATITIYNRQELSAGDKVSLTFPKGTLFASATLNKGSATSTFSAPVKVAETPTSGPKLTYELLVGNPLPANSKIELVLDPTYVPKAGAVVYEAKDGFTNAVKDTAGSGAGVPNQATLIKTVAQEVVTLTTSFDGFVERTVRKTFTPNKGSLEAILNVERAVATVYADSTPGNLVVLKANGALDNLTSVTISDGTTDEVVLAAAFTASSTAPGADLDTATFDVSGLDVNEPWTITAQLNAAETIPLVDFTVTREVTYDQKSVAPGAVDLVKTSSFAAGQFQLDASVVNVPYLPVGYAQFSSTVEIANLGSTDAEITIEAVGKTNANKPGKKYDAVTLTKVAKANRVTTISETDIMNAFGLSKGSDEKLSITFVIDADADKITLAPYYREGSARVNVISNQYKK